MKITIQASIVAPMKKVWEYYTDPKHIIHWNFASSDWCCPSAENDLRVGGKYQARMEAKDKSVGFDFEGVYEDVVVGDRFTFSLADGRRVSVSFENRGKETLVVTTFDAETENSVDMQRTGWQQILDNFKKYVEEN
jgi:uncharacterized protein YndB with AHSA1/START domain